jgi:hypothetical protein
MRNSAQSEAGRRFAINTVAMVLFGLVFVVTCYFAKPILDANPQHPIGGILIGGFFAGFAGLIGLYFYVHSMRSRCPKCGKIAAVMITEPRSGDVYFECKECDYSERIGWQSD